MKIGLIHGIFQPFHNGHKFLVDKMLKECDLGVVLIGSATKKDSKNTFDVDSRKRMIRSIYGKNKKLFIGANIDLDSPHSKNAQWDVVLASCVLSLTGHLPTHVYAGDNYSVVWKRVRPKIIKFKRYNKISVTDVRKLMQDKKLNKAKQLVPKEVFKMIKSS